MKIVIEISEEEYNRMKEKKMFGNVTVWKNAICNGTPLPKGHGDLIDRSTLEPDTEWSDWDDGWISYSYRQIADADVVIKADGGGEDAISN